MSDADADTLMPLPKDALYWRRLLFELAEPVIMSPEIFDEVWPFVDSVYSKISGEHLQNNGTVKVQKYECRLRKSKQSGTRRPDTGNIKRRRCTIREKDLCHLRMKVSRSLEGEQLVKVERLDEHLHTHDIEESFRIKKPTILFNFLRAEVAKGHTAAHIFHTFRAAGTRLEEVGGASLKRQDVNNLKRETKNTDNRTPQLGESFQTDVFEAPNLRWLPNAGSSCAGPASSSPSLPTLHRDVHSTSHPPPSTTMEPAILLFGTCDTKLPQLLLLRSQILSHGCQVLLADVGRTPCDSSFIDIPASHFLPAGISLSHLPRNELITAMTSYFTAHIKHLENTHRICGAISLGGSGGTTLAASAMRAALPIGFPKLIVTTMASGDVSCYVGDSDITLMPSIVDIAGSNEILTRILSNAAGAIAGMASSYNTTTTSEKKKAVAITMFGVTTPAVTAAQQVLEARGYETLILHATGSGGRVLERLVREHRVQGVLDITTTELADELFGGVLSAGPERLTAAAETGTPQIVSVGALDCINFGPKETVPQRFRGQGRKIVVHNPSVTLVRTTVEECTLLGKHIGEKLRHSKGKTEVWCPGKGVSMLSQEGGPFFDPEADKALVEALRSALEGSKVVFRYFPDVPLNDLEWARSMAQKLVELMED